MPILSPSEWETFLNGYPDAHLLQTTAWGELKNAFGWQALRVLVEDDNRAAGVQLLIRRLPFGLNFAYAPKGPLGAEPGTRLWEPLWREVDRALKKRRCVFLKVEPDAWEGLGELQKAPKGFRLSKHSIQPPRTMVVDLRNVEETLLQGMKQKTRYNIRLAEKKGVRVSPSSDIEIFSRLMQLTGERDRFGVHSLEYYQKTYRLFHPRGECELLFAEVEGQPVAGLMVFAHGSRAWYLYGASSNDHRERMPTYLLQWEAMRWARQQGCLEYDLWGVPDEDEAQLEAGFTERKDGLWGVYRFKRGFGGELLRSSGPWDRVYQPFLYALYRWWMSRRGE